VCFFGGHGVNLIIGESMLPKFCFLMVVIRNETRPVCLLVYGAARGLGRVCGGSEFYDLVVERLILRRRFARHDGTL
jgi:hypothetical protein